jgi:hypothetical protein
MTNEEFVEERGFEEINKFPTLQKDIIEKCNGFISAEQLHYLFQKIEFDLENAYWDKINEVLNI